MNSINLRVHSFIDIITNSSTEIYIEATQHTIDGIYKLIDALLQISKSDLKSTDLFDIVLFDKYASDSDDEDDSDDDSYKDVSVKVTAKDSTDENAKIAAGILSALTDLFYINAKTDN